MKAFLNSQLVTIILFITVFFLSSYLVLKDDSEYSVVIKSASGSNMIMLGDDYNADIYITKKLPDNSIIKLSDSNEKYSVSKNESKFSISLKTDQEGMYNVHGNIEWGKNKRKHILPFEAEYFVMNRSGAIFSKCLIRGIPNEIEASVAGIAPQDVIIKTDNGKITKEGVKYYITPTYVGKCKIALEFKENDKIKTINTFLFEVFEKK